MALVAARLLVSHAEAVTRAIAQYTKDLADPVKSSLHPQVDDNQFMQEQGEAFEDHVRTLLEAPFPGPQVSDHQPPDDVKQ